MPALSVKNLKVKYPHYDYPAVDDISFILEEGKIAALIGPNGCGKSTLIKAILGLIPYSGEILLYGKPVGDIYPQIGYVPQRFNFDASFPVKVSEFISLTLIKGTNEENKKKIYQALSWTRADDLAEKKLSETSGGQLQRVLLARALVNNPKFLFLDEPEAGVDAGGEQTFYDLLEKLVRERKITALVASHELDIVYKYADTVLCLNKKLLCAGKPREVLDRKTFEKLYGRDLKFYGHDHIAE